MSGVLLVSTPQTAALEVTKRGAGMYSSLKAPIIGLVENMSHTVCPNCQTKINLFDNVTEKFAASMKIKVLESIPIHGDVAQASDNGQPLVLKSPNSDYAKSYRNLSKQLIDFLEMNKQQKTG